MEHEAKFRQATAGIEVIWSVPAPEMGRPDFQNIKNTLIKRYSQPAHPISSAFLKKGGYQSIVIDGREIYDNGTDALTCDENGFEIAHWPEGLHGRHVDYTSYDEEGYITSEEKRYYTPDLSDAERPTSYRAAFDYTINEGKKTLTAVRYRKFTIDEKLEIFHYPEDRVEYVIDLAPKEKEKEKEKKEEAQEHHRHLPFHHNR